MHVQFINDYHFILLWIDQILNDVFTKFCLHVETMFHCKIWSLTYWCWNWIYQSLFLILLWHASLIDCSAYILISKMRLQRDKIKIGLLCGQTSVFWPNILLFPCIFWDYKKAFLINCLLKKVTHTKILYHYENNFSANHPIIPFRGHLVVRFTRILKLKHQLTKLPLFCVFLEY